MSVHTNCMYTTGPSCIILEVANERTLYSIFIRIAPLYATASTGTLNSKNPTARCKDIKRIQKSYDQTY